MNKKQYIVEQGTYYYAKSSRIETSGRLDKEVTFEENELVAADLHFMTFKRGATNYTFHPDKVRAIL